MTRNIIIALLWGTLSFSFAQADTIIPGGYVSGTWTAAGSPYLVQGNITVHADSTLNIEPGVQVTFQGDYYFTVNGLLEAIGTETDSIYFAGAVCIRFENTPDSSHLSYCNMNNSYGLQCNGSSPVISNGTIHGGWEAILVNGDTIPSISDCAIRGDMTGISWHSAGGSISGCVISGSNYHGVWVPNGDLTFVDCVIENNSSTNHGGGVECTGAEVHFSNCTIRDNFADGRGGGVYCANGTATFSHCTIEGDSAEDTEWPDIGGGGIGLYNASAIISYCTIFDNWAAQHGGGISIGTSGTLSIDHCTIDTNWTDGPGLAVAILGSASAHITNSIISNGFSGSAIHNEGALTVEYSDFHSNPAGVYIGGNIPTGFGVLDTTNTNGDSCDVYYNIFMDPLFEDQPAGNLQITWANFPDPDTTKSPCIDAGDPASPLDPDSTIADMGCYFFDRRMPDIELSTSQLNFGTVAIGQSADLPLTIYNIGSDTLALFNLACGLTTFTTNWNPLDSLVLPGDSLEITVIFTPDDTLDYADTLCIENNCELCGVGLLGHGEALGVYDPVSGLPKEFALRGPYPNPFNPMTTFKIELPLASWVKLGIYDISGKTVATVLEGWRPAGYHEVTFDGDRLSSGVYLYQLNANDFAKSGKMVLMK